MCRSQGSCERLYSCSIEAGKVGSIYTPPNLSVPRFNLWLLSALRYPSAFLPSAYQHGSRPLHIESVNAMYLLVERQLCQRFSGSLSTKTEEIVSKFWCEDSANVVAKKLAEKERYDQELRRLFDDNSGESLRIKAGP